MRMIGMLSLVLVVCAGCTVPMQRESTPLPTAREIYGSEPDLALACRLMQASRCAYGISGQSFSTDKEFAGCNSSFTAEPRFYEDPIEHINAVFVGLTDNGKDKEIIIAYRGTLPLKNGDKDQALKDWIQDGDALPWIEKGVEGKMHHGFLKAFNDTWDPSSETRARTTQKPLKDILQDLQVEGKNIYITGHSKGGPVAIIAATHLFNQRIVPTAVYTFAGARAGNAEFRSGYIKQRIPTWRFENRYDVVPHLPLNEEELAIHALLVKKFPDLEVRDYGSVGNLMYINWDGNLQPETPNLAKLRRDMFIAIIAEDNPFGPAFAEMVVNAHTSGQGGEYYKAACNTANP